MKHNLFDKLNTKGLEELMSRLSLMKVFSVEPNYILDKEASNVYEVIEKEDVFEAKKKKFVQNVLSKEIGQYFDEETTDEVCSLLEGNCQDEEIERLFDIFEDTLEKVTGKEVSEFSVENLMINGVPVSQVKLNGKSSKLPDWVLEKMLKGTNVHGIIAKNYVDKHPGQDTYTNTTPIKSILKTDYEISEDVLNEKIKNDSSLENKLAAKPDILNATRNHLYEIKTRRGQDRAVSESKWYINIFNSILGPDVIEPGPVAEIEPGIIHSEKFDSYFYYQSPYPGVIIYEEIKKEKQNVKVEKKVNENNKEMHDTDTMTFDYWKSKTGLDGLPLVLYIIFSIVNEGVEK